MTFADPRSTIKLRKIRRFQVRTLEQLLNDQLFDIPQTAELTGVKTAAEIKEDKQIGIAMTQTQSPTNWFSGICLAAFLTIISASAAAPQTGVVGLNPAEKWAVTQVTKGEIADLSEKFPDERDRKFSARFLEDLLTGTLSGVKPHRNGVRIRGAIVDEPIDLRNAQIPSGLELDHCQFVSAVDFGGASFGSFVSVQRSTFKANAYFNSVKAGSGAFFFGAVFKGPVDFGSAEITGIFVADESLFTNTEQGVSFNGMTVKGGAYFRKVVFEGPVDFGGANIASNFDADGAQFRSKTEIVHLEIKGGTGFFENVSFAGPVSFANSSFFDLLIGGISSGDAPVAQLDLSYSSIKRKLRIRAISIQDFVASSVHVEGPAEFTDLSVEHSADLSDSDFVTLDLSRSNWPKGAGAFHLEGMNYKYVRTAATESESHEALLKLANQSAYAPDVYTKLEAFFLRQGYFEDADRAFNEMKHRERREYLHGTAWIGSWLGDFLTDYGRHPSRTGIPCAFFVLLGCFLFSARKMELQRKEDAPRVYNPFWYSLGLFLPFVDLQSSNVWKPKPDQTFLRNYARVHILLGWILIPIVLAALTGLIK